MKVFAAIAIAALALVGCSPDEPPAVEEVTDSELKLTEPVFKDVQQTNWDSLPPEQRENICLLTDFNPAGLEEKIRADWGSNTVGAEWTIEFIYEVCGS